MFERIPHHDLKIIATDGNFTYNTVIPRDVRHIVSKSETCLVESFNSKIRHYIPCLAPKTKTYVKSKEALNRAMKFFMFKDIICG